MTNFIQNRSKGFLQLSIGKYLIRFCWLEWVFQLSRMLHPVRAAIIDKETGHPPRAGISWAHLYGFHGPG